MLAGPVRMPPCFHDRPDIPTGGAKSAGKKLPYTTGKSLFTYICFLKTTEHWRLHLRVVPIYNTEHDVPDGRTIHSVPHPVVRNL